MYESFQLTNFENNSIFLYMPKLWTKVLYSPRLKHSMKYIHICCFITNYNTFSFQYSRFKKSKWQCFIFKMVAERHLGCLKSLNFIGWRVRGAETHQRAKFRRNWSIRHGDNAIIRHSRWRPSAILYSFVTYLDHPRRWSLWSRQIWLGSV